MLNSAYAHHDRITLSGITAVGFHGVLDFEKRDGQPFTVDATLYTDFADAAAGDDLEKTTNYAQVAELIHQKIVFGSLDLIETLAVRIAEGILADFARIALCWRWAQIWAGVRAPLNGPSSTFGRRACASCGSRRCTVPPRWAGRRGSRIT